ncbi:MAG: aminotransferase class I/II-fold pyridoxal phosphate-dependent enzyme [Candidatus Algichlamydia australiensis]|nr:aminotransferase class I/II-fold pyridoxal phosphate-dependent enzyme [Chlamydiales bacterium]
MKQKFLPFAKTLKKRQEQRHYQQLRAILPTATAQKNQIVLNSSDPLGLSNHPFVKERTLEYLLKWASGSTPTRLIPEHLIKHEELEEKLAKLLGTESALLLPSSFAVHDEIFKLIAPQSATLLIDRLAKNPLYQAAYRTGAEMLRFEHNDPISINREICRAEKGATKILIAESLSTYEGDFAPLRSMIEIADESDTLLLIDEQNALSLYGPFGMGLCAKHPKVDLITGTFPKKCGNFNSYIGCSNLLKEFFLTSHTFQSARPLPPALLGVIEALLDLIPDMQIEREALEEKCKRIREQIQDLGLKVGKSQSHIIPVICGADRETQELMGRLTEAGIVATAIKPPAVPPGKSRINLHITKDLRDEQIEILLQTLKHPKRSLQTMR